MIGDKFNMDDTFFRDLTVCLLDTLEGQVRWVNRFSSGNYPVDVPFYYSLTGDERFLLDSFQDDIASENRFVELNSDTIPRGHITLKNFTINSSEFSNPNVWLKTVVENEVEIKKMLGKVRAIPITVSYSLEMKLANEIDVFKANQAILDTIWLYKFMYFEFNFMHIDAVMQLPDSNTVEINREKDMSTDNTIKLNVDFEVQTYYPAFRRDRLQRKCYDTKKTGDLNNYETSDGAFSDYFTETKNFTGNRDFSNYPTSSNSDESNSEYFECAPKQSRWFNNILKAREKSSTPINNNTNEGNANKYYNENKNRSKNDKK